MLRFICSYISGFSFKRQHKSVLSQTFFVQYQNHYLHFFLKTHKFLPPLTSRVNLITRSARMSRHKGPSSNLFDIVRLYEIISESKPILNSLIKHAFWFFLYHGSCNVVKKQLIRNQYIVAAFYWLKMLKNIVYCILQV